MRDLNLSGALTVNYNIFIGNVSKKHLRVIISLRKSEINKYITEHFFFLFIPNKKLAPPHTSLYRQRCTLQFKVPS